MEVRDEPVDDPKLESRGDKEVDVAKLPLLNPATLERPHRRRTHRDHSAPFPLCRVIAVGTTTVRTLEGVAQLTISNKQFNNETIGDRRYEIGDSVVKLRPYVGEINIFIKPGFNFKIVDGMITNFHLPKSTLLMLVSAFAGSRQFMLKCYKKAVKKKYRFYSFGDAMFII